MELILLIIYSVIVWLLYFKLRLLPWNFVNQVIVFTLPIFALIIIILFMILGNFELDYTDGEVRFKTSLQLNGTPLTPRLLQPLIFGNVRVMDTYLPGLQAVIALTHTPAGAIQAIENGESIR